MKYISLVVTTVILFANTALAGWITSNRGATIESSTSDAKKFVFLLYSQGAQAAALSLYDDLPKDKVKDLQIDPLKITGDLELIHDIFAGMYKSAAKQKIVEARLMQSAVSDERKYEFVFVANLRSGKPVFTTVFLAYSGFGTEHGSRDFSVQVGTEKPKLTAPI